MPSKHEAVKNINNKINIDTFINLYLILLTS
jgi:hypothetical protein